VNIDIMPRRRAEQGAWLETLYARYNRRGEVNPDPLLFLYRYPRLVDREIVGLIASSLAYGRVAMIMRNVEATLARLEPRPFDALADCATPEALCERLTGIRHRWTSGCELAALLWGARALLQEQGSLQGCWANGTVRPEGLLDGLSRLVASLRAAGGVTVESALLPDPASGSACKRLNLFLRWMVRCDEVDPGGWETLAPSALLMPLDVHTFRMGRRLGLVRRRSPDLKAVLELTAALARFRPDDPVRYDFALSRWSMRGEAGAGV
jgi:uncharacterized protein (TIGR02757 family)